MTAHLSPYVMPGLIRSIADMKLNKDALPVILKIVEDVTGIPQKQIVKQNREAPVAIARHLYCGIAKKNTVCNRKDIAEFIKRERTIIYNSVCILDDLLETDETVKEQYEKIKLQLFIMYNS